MKRNCIGANDEIYAKSFDKNNNIIASLYDDGFTSVRAVASELLKRGNGKMKPIKRIHIKNETKEWANWYVKKGDKFVKE